jgi:predicted PurR-regulated permease PerM
MMKTTWNKPTKYIVGIGLVLLGLYGLYLSRPVIPSLVVAALIALIVRPVISWLQERLHLARGPAVGLTYLCLAILVPLAIMLILPTLSDALVYVASLDYQSILQSGADGIRSMLISIQAVQLPITGFDAYVDRAIDSLLQGYHPVLQKETIPPSLNEIVQPFGLAFRSMMQAGASLVGAVFSRAAMIFFVFLSSIYISLDAQRYRDALQQIAPAHYHPEISFLLTRIERVWSGFFRGELTLMLVIGVITTVGLTALGIPGALYLGIIAGLLEIVPTMGPILATVPAVIVALVNGSATLPVSHLALAGLVILFYILVQQVENNLIVPRVLGAAVDLPPLVVMTGVIVGASVGGILGALLSTPVIATGREVLHYVHCKLLDQDPTQVEEKDPQPGTSSPHWLSPLSTKIRRRIQTGSFDPRANSSKDSHSQGKPG